MKKALEILKHTYNAIEQLGIGHISTEYTEKDFLFLEEAIKELEELKNRGCIGCINLTRSNSQDCISCSRQYQDNFKIIKNKQ